MNEDPRYTEVNQRSYPPLTRKDAYQVARRLLRKLGSPTFCAVRDIKEDGNPVLPSRVVLDNIFAFYIDHNTSKGRTCWASAKPTTGHDKGWGRLIHDVSHMLQQYRHPGERPHGGSHHSIEREVAMCVDTSGYIRAFTPQKINREAGRAARLIRQRARLDRWVAKRKRADTAIKKLTRTIKAAEQRAIKAMP